MSTCRPTFIDDDDGYLRWVTTHNDGFIVNTYRRPSAAYLRLHRPCDLSNDPGATSKWLPVDRDLHQGVREQ